jgi:hypothetical protein
VRLLPKWKKDANQFTVSVNHNETRGYQSSIPKPVMETLGNPDKITFVVKPKKKVEVVAGKSESREKAIES